MSAILYSIVNTLNGKEYVGVTQTTLKQRWNVHLYKLRKGAANNKLQFDFDKYGEDVFAILKMSEGELSDMLKLEKKETVRTSAYGYNIIIGGGGVEERSRASNVGHEKMRKDKEFRELVSRKISNSNIGRKWSIESRNRMSAARKGRICSDSVKQALSLAYSGSGNPNYGKHKLYLNLENGIYYTTPELWVLFGISKSSMQILMKKQDSKLSNFVKV